MTIARFTPLRDVVSLREAMDRLFEDSFTDETKDGWLRQERRFGKFIRSFTTLPMQIDPNKVEAKFNNGVLEVVLPKAENVKPRSIKINANNK